MAFDTAETTMWRLAQRYSGRVGYQRGVKSEGLCAHPAVIDCSGWVRVLLTNAMHAENLAAGRTVFDPVDVQALQAWSDRIIQEIEVRTGFILEGQEVANAELLRCATIGLNMGVPVWAGNHPRSRGITHIVQIVRRPEDDAPFISESFGGSSTPGVSLTPLPHWLDRWKPYVRVGGIWAVDPFRLAAKDQGGPGHTP